MGMNLETALRSRLLDELQGVEVELVIFDEIEHEISLEVEKQLQAERKLTYGEGFGSWA